MLAAAANSEVLVWLVIGAIVAIIVAYVAGKSSGKEEREAEFSAARQSYETKVTALQQTFDARLKAVPSEWRDKYHQELLQLRAEFAEAEKEIRRSALDASRRTLIGKFIEQFVPFLPHAKLYPSDMRFIGGPIDYIVFDGLHQDQVERIVFLEVKTGAGALTKREASVKRPSMRGASSGDRYQ